MPYSKAHKAQTRARILAAAAQTFRAEGIGGVGIPAVMARAGLTHGGFYAHFATKDALVADACATGFADAAERLLTGAAQAEPADALRAVIRGYLSRHHRDNPATGCMIPTLAAEIARDTPATRAAFTQSLTTYAQQLSEYLPVAPRPAPTANPAAGDANDDAQRMDGALVLLSGMAGALQLARAVDDPDLSHRILKAARAFYLHAFDTPSPPVGASQATGEGPE